MKLKYYSDGKPSLRCTVAAMVSHRCDFNRCDAMFSIASRRSDGRGDVKTSQHCSEYEWSPRRNCVVATIHSRSDLGRCDVKTSQRPKSLRETLSLRLSRSEAYSLRFAPTRSERSVMNGYRHDINTSWRISILTATSIAAT